MVNLHYHFGGKVSVIERTCVIKITNINYMITLTNGFLTTSIYIYTEDSTKQHTLPPIPSRSTVRIVSVWIILIPIFLNLIMKAKTEKKKKKFYYNTK